jgi:hypothetical protein
MAPAAGYFLSRDCARRLEGRLKNVEDNVVQNLETYHRQLCPLHRYAGILQDYH